jgi:hypothetical protein
MLREKATVLVELFSGTFDDARYGIATVQPSRSIKKCRIRNLRVEYGLSKIAVFLAVPKACINCENRMFAQTIFPNK